MKYLAALLCLLCLLCLIPRAHAFGWPSTNDNIFPALPAAKPYISFDGRGFLVHGKRTYIVAGEFQYPRTPRAMWRERLLRIKRAGYNTVQTYVYWNYHEPTKGRFEFTGEKDLDAYLKLIHSLGLYAIVRIGPYVNAEWDSGGLPVWLRFEPGLRPMTDNAPFYDAVTPYLDKIAPILAANQINHGGPILMVQLENEHTLPEGGGGGTDLSDPYYRWYYKKARAMGLEVPLFFSGLNHSDDPAGSTPFDTSQRTSPWYSTEFWTGWYGVYGVEPSREKKLERATWHVIAYGGAGYTHYTMAGGTDFDTWNNDQQAASYDFGSPIGQAGDLRDSYYYCKKAALFATSFQNLLANSVAKDGGDGVTTTDINVQITSRKGPAGEAIFLNNRSDSAVPTQFKIGTQTYPDAGPMILAPGEIVPILRGYQVAPGVSLALAAARVLGMRQFGNLTTLVVYGSPNEPVELHFAVAHARKISTASGLILTATQAVLKTLIPSTQPRVFVFQVGRQTVRVLTMTAALADRTWFLNNGALIACGPDYVGDVETLPNGTVRLETERNSLAPLPAHPQPTLLFTSDARQPLTLTPIAAQNEKLASVNPPILGPWQTDTSLPLVQPAYDDADWKASMEPLQMGADGDYGAYAWYRTTVFAPATGTYQLNFSDGGDWVSGFVNGKHTASFLVPSDRRIAADLNAGPNQVAFLTAHYGRDKLFNYYGPMGTIAAKGILGTVSLTKSAGTTTQINAFRWQADDKAPTDAETQAAPGLSTSGPAWADATTATDVFNGRLGWAWFRAVLPDAPGPHRRLFFHSIDNVGVVYLNGKQIAASVGLNSDVSLSLDAAWHEGGPNVLAVAVQNTGGPGGLTGEVNLKAGLENGTPITNWKMHGGLTLPAKTWQKFTEAKVGVPAFYHAAFAVVPPAASGPHPILRASLTGLSRGFMWLNGRCLGRYPERSPINGLYFPESLLKPGYNDLVIFDEDGNSPSQVRIIIEQAASRTGQVLVTQPR